MDVTVTRHVLSDLTFATSPGQGQVTATSPPSMSADLSDQFQFWFNILVPVFLSAGVSGLGIVTNVINIMVFKRHGLQDSVTILLFGLSVLDLVSVLITLWSSVCYGLELLDPPYLTFDPFSLYVMTAALPRVVVSRLTCWMTAIISVQRCLSVVLPFRSRQIITARSSVATVATVTLAVAFSYLWMFTVREIQVKVDQTTNVTKLFYVYVTKGKIDEIVNVALFLVLPFANFILILMCTVVMITSLKRATKWRYKVISGSEIPSHAEANLTRQERKTKRDSTTGVKGQGCDDTKGQGYSKGDVKTTKETKTSKLIVVIMTIFIACNLPSNVVVAARNIVPGFNDFGRLKNLFLTSYSLGLLLEAVSSSVNIFAYYSMSSRFKSTLDVMSSRFKST
ncbi:uncharacterized protein LOC131938748 [Physella acuta]|uniref:uncharacterized protein LOC131938748 n=1 Tax=Physella acuta TaxID=109671 RepID=UPI0027DAE59A|nr:uncharacterized protein LOC131938748 [Physella acuta]